MNIYEKANGHLWSSMFDRLFCDEAIENDLRQWWKRREIECERKWNFMEMPEKGKDNC